MGIYTKTRKDFDSKEDYDMYLEEVEDIIYKLTSNTDVADVEQQVEDYTRQEAALAGVTAGPVDGPPAYVPQAVAAQVLQPAPLQPVQQDAEGRLLPVQPGAAMDRQKWQLMATASGWTQELATERMLHDAFTTIFVF
uniref:MAT1 centre domain-containing protein n=1 Tax=Tetradesmus obliquus TaxID=3088 RepID=A0A383VE14_TETOB|eukprot:jgi/Sobl393_1/13477/SZX63180.1